MMDGSVGRAIAGLVGGAFAVTLVSVIFSTRANTAQVLASGGAAFAGVLNAATAPITGNTAATAAASSIAGLAAPLYSSSASLAGSPAFDT